MFDICSMVQIRYPDALLSLAKPKLPQISPKLTADMVKLLGDVKDNHQLCILSELFGYEWPHLVPPSSRKLIIVINVTSIYGPVVGILEGFS